MGVRKFRSVEEMKGPQPLRPLDPENLRIACGLSSLELFAPVRRTPGGAEIPQCRGDVQRARPPGQGPDAEERSGPRPSYLTLALGSAILSGHGPCNRGRDRA